MTPNPDAVLSERVSKRVPGIYVGKEEAMDTPTKRTTNSGEISMARPSEEAIIEENDQRETNNQIVPGEFEEPASGHDLLTHVVDHWLEHEAELVRPIHISLSESPDALTIRADVPGVKEEDLKIKVEPARVMITRNPISGTKTRTLYSSSYSDTATRVIDLPETVAVNKVRITVRDGVLELDLAKAEPIKDGTAKPNPA